MKWFTTENWRGLLCILCTPPGAAWVHRSEDRRNGEHHPGGGSRILCRDLGEQGRNVRQARPRAEAGRPAGKTRRAPRAQSSGAVYLLVLVSCVLHGCPSRRCLRGSLKNGKGLRSLAGRLIERASMWRLWVGLGRGLQIVYRCSLSGLVYGRPSFVGG